MGDQKLDDIEIQVVEDDVELEKELQQQQTPVKTPIEGKEDDDLDDQNSSEPEEAIKNLQRKLAEERLARAEAERRAQLAQQEADHNLQQKELTDIQIVDSAISQIKREKAQITKQIAEASVVGDHERLAELTSLQAQRSAELIQLEQGKIRLESRPKVEERRQRTDPVDDLANRLSPRSAAWVRANPQYVTDPRLNQKMLAAHNLAVADGLEVDSDAYFNSVEETLRIKKATQRQEEDAMEHSAKEVRQRQSSPPAAPVSRNTPSNGGNRPNVVRLTTAERQMAIDLGMDEKEYAANKVALQKEGRIK
jgi:hypothetical protein